MLNVSKSNRDFLINTNFYYNFRRADDELKPYPVAIAPELVNRLEDALQQLNIRPVALSADEDSKTSEISILVSVEYKVCQALNAAIAKQLFDSKGCHRKSEAKLKRAVSFCKLLYAIRIGLSIYSIKNLDKKILYN